MRRFVLPLILLLGTFFIFQPIQSQVTDSSQVPFEKAQFSDENAWSVLDYGYDMDLSARLDGRIPGLEVSSVGVVPGGFVRMNIRGINTVFGGTEPLIVIDGIPFENASYNAAGYRFSGLGEIDPADVASIEVLKDAGASAIYGSRAANGVILIQTKKGKAGKKKVQISYQFGMTSPAKKRDLLDSDAYMSTLSQAWLNSNPGSSDPAPVNQHTYDGFYAYPYTDTLLGQSFPANLSQTDWYNDMQQQGSFHKVNFHLSGGDDHTIYYIGGGFRRETSVFFNGEYQRANARLRLSHQANRKLRLGINLYLTSNIRNINDKDWFGRAQSTALPVYPVYSPIDPDEYWFQQAQPVNIQALNEYSWNRSGGYRTFNTAYVQYEIIEGLKLRSEWSWDFQHYLHEDYKHPNVAPAENGLMIINRSDRSNWTSNNYLSFERDLGVHHLSAFAGASFENYNWGANQIYNPGMTLAFIHSNGESNQLRQVGVWWDNSRWVSIYGRVNYEFSNRYFAQLSVRNDASSAFGPDKRWFLAPAAALEWRILNESFASPLERLFDRLNLRASYGIVGNAQIGSFTHLSSMTEGYYDDPYISTNGYYRYGKFPAVVPVNIANTKLSAEPNSQLDVGLDLAMLDSRLGLKANWFMNQNSGMLNYVPMSILYGYESDHVWENNGVLKTSGLELSLDALLIDKPSGVKWSAMLNLSTVQTILQELPAHMEYLEGYYNRAYPGESLGGYYLAKWAGVEASSGHELIFDPISGEAVDAELLTEEEFTASAQYISDKTPFPKLYGGLFTSVAFKGVDLQIQFTAKSGHHLLDLGEQSMSYISSGSTALASLPEDYANGEAALLYESTMAGRVTDRFLHDASYVRLENLSLGYRLPAKLSERIFMESTRVYLSGVNLFTLTSFPGYDPNGLYSDYHTMSPLDAGLLLFDPPRPRSILVGIQFTF